MNEFFNFISFVVFALITGSCAYSSALIGVRLLQELYRTKRTRFSLTLLSFVVSAAVILFFLLSFFYPQIRRLMSGPIGFCFGILGLTILLAALFYFCFYGVAALTAMYRKSRRDCFLSLFSVLFVAGILLYFWAWVPLQEKREWDLRAGTGGERRGVDRGPGLRYVLKPRLPKAGFLG